VQEVHKTVGTANEYGEFAITMPIAPLFADSSNANTQGKTLGVVKRRACGPCFYTA